MEHLTRDVAGRGTAWDVVLAICIIAAGLAEVWAPLSSAMGDGSPLASSVVVVLLGVAVACGGRGRPPCWLPW